MLYLFTGSDTTKVRTKAFAWVAAARAKAPDASYVRLNAPELTEETIDEIVASQGLFFSKMLVLIDDPFSLSEASDLILTRLSMLAESKNPIALLAPNLLASRAKKIEAVSEKVFISDLREKKVPRGFNSSLVNALTLRKGPELWLELKKAERAGDVPELLHGLLHWKARDLMKKGGSGWTPEEARALSRSLIEILSDSRSGDVPLAMQLERFALSL